MDEIISMKAELANLTRRYDEMKRIYKGIDGILFKNKELKQKQKLLGQEMYKVNLQQIRLLHKISGINIE